MNLTMCDRCAHCITKCPNVTSVTYNVQYQSIKP